MASHSVLPKDLMKSGTKANLHKVTKTIVTSPDIYKPVGPYSQAILADKTLYVSGLLGMDTDARLVGGPEAQMRQALDNLKHVLEAGGSSLDAVVKCTVLLNDLHDLQPINMIYMEYFPREFPARCSYQAGKLPLGAAVELEAIALSGDLVVAEAGPCPCTVACNDKPTEKTDEKEKTDDKAESKTDNKTESKIDNKTESKIDNKTDQ